MPADPKKIKVKLSPKEYHELREQVYWEQCGICLGCGIWFEFKQFSLHHKDRAVGDVRSNVSGWCVGCHPD